MTVYLPVRYTYTVELVSQLSCTRQPNMLFEIGLVCQNCVVVYIGNMEGLSG